MSRSKWPNRIVEAPDLSLHCAIAALHQLVEVRPLSAFSLPNAGSCELVMQCKIIVCSIASSIVVCSLLTSLPIEKIPRYERIETSKNSDNEDGETGGDNGFEEESGTGP